jgi:hypothetical protein
MKAGECGGVLFNMKTRAWQYADWYRIFAAGDKNMLTGKVLDCEEIC